MKKINIFSILLSMLMGTTVLCQNSVKKFDITTYKSLQHFTEKITENGLLLSLRKDKDEVDIFIFKSVVATGTATEQYKNFWRTNFNSLPLPADKDLQQETRKDGVKVIAGGGGDAQVIYLVASHYIKNKVVPVFITMNTNNYAKEIESFVDELTFNTLTTTNNLKPIANKPVATARNNRSTSNNTNSTPEIFKDKYITGTGIFSDHSYIVPPAGKSTFHQQYTNLIKIKNDDLNESGQPFWIDIFPLELSSGSLETDAENIIAKNNQGYVPFIRSGGTSSNIAFERGRTMQGFEYLKVKKNLIKKTDNNTDVKAEIVAVIKVGNKIAPILLEEDVDASWDKGDEALAFILMTIKFNNIVSPGTNLQKDLLGTWGSVGTTGGSGTSYYGTNTFDWGGASQTRTSKDADYDYVYSKTFGGTGTYNVKGNVLTETWKATKSVGTKLISPIQRKVNDEPWQSYLWSIRIDPKNCECDGLPCLSNFWQPLSRW